MKLTGAWYNSSDGGGPGEQGPASGAYIFRPNGIFIATGPVPTTSIHGPVVTEVHQVCSRCIWRRFFEGLYPQTKTGPANNPFFHSI